MAATIFQKSTADGQLFYALNPSAGLPLRAFNLRQAWAPPAPQTATSVALPDAAKLGGVFLFLGAPLVNETAFLARLRTLIAHPQYRTSRLMWIVNPNAREDQWMLWNIRLSGNQVGALALFDLSNYALGIGVGCAFTAQDSAFVIAPNDDSSIFLTVGYGARRLAVVPKGPVTISYANNPGCLTFPIEAGDTFFDDVESGCRLFFPDQTSVRYPVFAPTPSVALLATLDPLAPLDASRTAFAFTPGQTLNSYFRTNGGRAATLTSMAGAQLQFTPLDAAHYYLAPAGPFGIQAPGNPPRLLCGIFGAEFVELTADSILTFTPNQPAMVEEPGLTRTAVTSWAAVTSPTVTLCYSGVPDGAGYFRPAVNQDLTLLDYYPACSAFLPQSNGAPHPLLPYAGVQASDSTLLLETEQQVLAPLRRQIVHDNQAATPVPPPTDDTDAVTALTPQGLVGLFSADRTQWTTLTIGGSDAGPFRLTNIVDPLRSALLTNQQFVVISDPSTLVPHFDPGHNVIEIEGWQFTVNQTGWNRYSTLFIVKNSPRALNDLAADLNSWTLATRFNSSPGRTQQQLLGILKQAVQSGAPDLGYFVNTVASDPAWNGVLILNCPLTALPASFQGLAGVLNPSGLVAHHIGFNQTPVARTVTAQDAQVSSLFGLVHYTDNSPPTGNGDFELKVTLLEVLFRNSVVTELAATADFYVRALFGAQVSPPSRAPLKLKGTVETHGDAKVFALVSAEGPRTLALNDSVLTGVRIQNTHFGTKSTDATGAVTSRFDFWGGLQFAALRTPDDAFDLFSYADLSFSKMGANMTVGGDGRQVFQFDPFAMTFDASASQVRPGSLADRFPMTLKGFTFSPDKTSPTGAGYLAIALSQMTVSPVTLPWYGLVFNLNLGTLGTLAADAGLVATFAVIWTPGNDAPKVFAGIHLPGLSGGQNQVSLMGVVKLGMHSVELVRQGGAFVLLLDGIALTLFGRSLPPGGSFDFYLFGAGANQLAWYGAYLKNQ